MAEPNRARKWTMRVTLVVLALWLIFFHLLPLETTPRRWAGPDVLVALIFAWAARRPDYVPVLLVAAIMLLADLMFQRPPGLWAALTVLGVEWIKGRGRQSETTFALEWLSVAVLLAGMTLVYRVVLAVTLTGSAPLVLTLMQLVMTIAVYPVIVVLSHTVLGVRRTAPGRADSLGSRI